jgi:hypothetical protein
VNGMLRLVTAAVVTAGVVAVAPAPADAATIANPGPFTATFTSVNGNLGQLSFGTTAGTAIVFASSIDADGNVAVPDLGTSFAAIPVSGSASGVSVSGVVTFAAGGPLSGSLDPETGSASLGGSMYGSLSLVITGPLIGYTGTCALGSAASPLAVAFTTAAPGVPYSQTTGALTLTTPLAAPSLAGCDPALPPLLAFVADIVLGAGRLTLAGQLSPIITAVGSGGGETTQGQSVTAEVGSTLAVSAPASIAFPRLLPGQTSAPVSSAVTVTSNDPAGYQLSVSRTPFTPADIPLAIQSSAPGAGMALDLLLGVATAIPTSGSLAVGHRSGTIAGPSGDVWPTSLVLGPVPNVSAGTYSATVTYTVVGL